MTQETADILAGLAHVFKQMERTADAQEKELEQLRADRRALCDLLSADPATIAGQTLIEAVQALQEEREELRALARAVCASAARELNYSDDVLLVSSSALRALERVVNHENT